MFLLVAAAQPAVAASPNSALDSQIGSRWGSGIFHWLTLFEGLAGYTTAGQVELDGMQARLTASPMPGSRTYLIKQPGWQNFLSFNRPSAFRSALVVSGTENIRAYLVHGSALSDTGRSYYGFKVVNNAIFGVTSGNGTEAERFVPILGDLSPTQAYTVEARFYPGKKVVFEVEPMSEGKKVRAEITSGLPVSLGRPNIDLLNISVETKDDSRKSIGVSFFEFLQSSI